MLTNEEIQIYGALKKLKIPYEVFPHPPITTLDEGLVLTKTIKAAAVKNLFLTAPKKKQFFLLLLAEGESFAGKALQETLGSGHLTFGDKEDLSHLLCCKKGSVSALGLLFDTGQAVTLLISRTLLSKKDLVFHPCRNDKSLKLSAKDLINRFWPATGHIPRIIDASIIDAKEESL